MTPPAETQGKRAPPSKEHFTKNYLEGIPPAPEGKRTWSYDTKVPGLAIQVTTAGTKTFYLYRWVDGRPEKMRLGNFPAMTVEQARQAATKALGEIAQGNNPANMRRTSREEWSLQDLFDDYLERHAKPHKKSWKEDADQYRRYLTPWAKRKLSKIKKAEVKALHIEIGENHGRYAANRLLALLRGMVNYGIRERELELSNPAVGITLFKEEERERRLMSDELPAFFEALAEEPNETIRDYVLLSLLTGGRRDNVLTMRWDELHLARATWEVPSAKFKNGRQQSIHLARAAVTILEERQRQATGSPWVFTGDGATGHLVEPKTTWKRILERAGIDDLRLHDLRRTLASWQVDTGATLAIIGQTLGHQSQATTAIYARLSQDPVRKSVDTAVEAMMLAGGVSQPPTDEAIPLKKER